MAEYYPLLAKAIAGLPDSTPETRRVVYERARKALLGQLRALQPPVPEADVERESQALDSAVARLEAEFAQAAAPAPEPPAAAELPPPTPPAPAPSGAPPDAEPETLKLRPRPRLSSAQNLPEAGLTADRETSANAPAAPEAANAPNTPVVFPKGRQEPPSAPQPPSASQRPSAPQAPVARQNSRGLWIVMAVIAVLVAGIAVAAWKLRDRPEDLEKLKTTAQQTSEGSGKIISRADEAAQGTDVAAVTAPAASQAPAQSSVDVPVTYRAALLVQAPEEQNKVKTYFGTVIWRLDNVSNGPGEPLGTALHANIDIPEDKFQASWTLQKNLDANLPATHTMTITFTLQPTTPTGGIKQIGVPQMRREDSANGEALAGLPVPIMENSFLIGLPRGNAEAANLELLKTRQWVDIPILLSNGRIAKLTFEKGVAGQRRMEDALAAWQAGQ